MTNNFTPKKASDNRPKLSKEEYAEKKKAEKEAVCPLPAKIDRKKVKKTE